MSTLQDLVSEVVDFAQQAKIAFNIDLEHLNAHGEDFGHLIQGSPYCILQPQTVPELIKILKTANLRHYSLTPRGKGLSQSGQSLSPGGVSLDMSQFIDISFLSSHQIRCGAGVTWRQLLQRSASSSLAPYVMPLNLDLSIAGTLSAGGFGSSSFRYGPSLDYVSELEVVTGAGEEITCSHNLNQDLFHSMLGGQGRCGFITSATIKLRPFQTKIRTYYLLYSHLNQCLFDQQSLSKLDSVQYVEGFCSSSIQGLKLTSQGRYPLVHWQYGLHVSLEFENQVEVTQASQEVLSKLQYEQLIFEEDTETVEYLARYDARFKRMRQTNQWALHHPWFECFMSMDAAQCLIPRFLKDLPASLGDGHRIIACSQSGASPFFMQPNCSSMVAFALLPTGISRHETPTVLETLETFNKMLYTHGGKRYLSGWLGFMDEHDWKSHFGPQYENWCALKSRFDPNSVLESVLFQNP